ncbi:MAG: hypothetical protein ABL977_02955, partial [Candidatus Eisenbacteria bacterium]
TEPVPGLSTDASQPFAITLQEGWNLFGNPFAFTVAWADVIHDDAVSGNDLLAFDPVTVSYVAAPGATLEPFRGYFLHASRATTIQVMPRGAPLSGPERGEELSGTPAQRSAAWSLRLHDPEGDPQVAEVLFGFDGRALAGGDELDRHAPPAPPGEWVAGAIVPPGQSAGFAHDLRPRAGEGERWDVELRASRAGGVIDVELHELGTQPGSDGVRVFDREQGVVVAELPPRVLPEGSAQEPRALRFRCVSYGPAPYRLTVLTGSRSYLEAFEPVAATVPRELALDPVAPNPVRYAARFRFGLARPGPVRLDAFDASGRRVWSAPRALSGLPAGYHSVVWDCRDERGRRVAPGLYLIRLATPDGAITRRMVVLDRP